MDSINQNQKEENFSNLISQEALKTWFTEGEDDPRITVIKVSPTEGYYWDTRHGMAVAMVKRVVGAIKVETIDDSIEGNIVV